MNFSDLQKNEMSSEFLKKLLKEIESGVADFALKGYLCEENFKRYLVGKNNSSQERISDESYRMILKNIERSHDDLLDTIGKELKPFNGKKI